jgi:hypothetical protein
MEMNKVEIGAVQALENQVVSVVKELEDCELMLIGGGMGDITLG